MLKIKSYTNEDQEREKRKDIHDMYQSSSEILPMKPYHKTSSYFKKPFLNIYFCSFSFLFLIQLFIMLLIIYSYFNFKNDLIKLEVRMDTLCFEKILDLKSASKNIVKRTKRDLENKKTIETYFSDDLDMLSNKTLNNTFDNNKTINSKFQIDKNRTTIPEIILDDHFLKQISKKVDVIL